VCVRERESERARERESKRDRERMCVKECMFWCNCCRLARLCVCVCVARVCAVFGQTMFAVESRACVCV